MLDSMRKGVTNIFTKFLLGLLVLAFAVWGIGDMTFRGQDANVIATVGKTQLTVEDFRRTYDEELQAVSARLGRRLTTEEAKALGLHTRALTRMIGFAAIDTNAKELRVTVSDQIVANIIKGDASFKGLTGEFDRRKFQQEISKIGYRSENQYIRDRQSDIIREQLTETIGAAATPPRPVLEALYRYGGETRSVQFISPDLAKLIKVEKPDDAKLKAYFDLNKLRYVALESRKANVLLLSRDVAAKSITISDDDLKAAYEASKDTFNVVEKRRVSQMTFPDMAAADKAYAELSKAKNFDETAKKLGFPPNEIDLGLLSRAEMIDPKIAEATFGLKKDELSKPVQGQFSIALVRVSDIQGGKQRTYEEVKGEIRDRLSTDRVGQMISTLHDKAEDERAKGTPLKEIAQALKIPFIEVADITQLGKTSDGKTALDSADAPRIAAAIFAAAPGVETDIIDLADGGYAWFDLVSVTPQRERTFEETKAAAETDYLEAERRKEIEALATKQVDRIKGGASVDAIAKELGAKLETAENLKRGATAPGLTPAALQTVFALSKGDVASAPTVDGKSRTIFRIAEVKPAPAPTNEQLAALGGEIGRQIRIDFLEQYVAGLRTRYGFTVNEKALTQAMGGQALPAE
jgi:peptidyl-prolyl cis-trans isomerase D